MATTITRILYPTDFSANAEAALPPVKVLARLFHAEVLLLHVIEPLPLPPEAFVLGETWQALTDEARREAVARLDGLARVFKDQGVAVTSRVVTGSVVPRILETAKEDGVDLIALGTHGRTGLFSVFLGSVADKIVRLATCPVLTVRNPSIPLEESR